MTIRLTIKNEDTRENAIVEVAGVCPASGLPMDHEKQLRGGESCEVYIHAGKEFKIKEIKNG